MTTINKIYIFFTILHYNVVMTVRINEHLQHIIRKPNTNTTKQAGFGMESTGKAEEREVKEQLTTVNRGREKTGRLQLATVWRDSDSTERDGVASVRSYAPDESGGRGGGGEV